jgi:hypothetical protein
VGSDEHSVHDLEALLTQIARSLTTQADRWKDVLSEGEMQALLGGLVGILMRGVTAAVLLIPDIPETSGGNLHQLLTSLLAHDYRLAPERVPAWARLAQVTMVLHPERTLASLQELLDGDALSALSHAELSGLVCTVWQPMPRRKKFLAHLHTHSQHSNRVDSHHSQNSNRVDITSATSNQLPSSNSTRYAS